MWPTNAPASRLSPILRVSHTFKVVSSDPEYNICGEDLSAKHTALTSSSCPKILWIERRDSISYTTIDPPVVPATSSRPSPENRIDHIPKEPPDRERNPRFGLRPFP